MANEKRLIDANEAVKLLRGKCVAKYPATFLMGLLASANEVENFPTVDAVEVVRCKDCDYYEKEYRGFGFCKYFDVGRADNDFCSSCIRREGE